jgi:hypothetical protein
VIAFTLLTGARDGATVSFKLKHIHLDSGKLSQDAREVQTKRRKTFTTTFFPIDELPGQIVAQWVTELTRDHLFGPDDPLFPATAVTVGASGSFEARTIARKPWASSGPVRTVFGQQFARAGLRYFNPHSVRNLIAQIGQIVCRGDIEAYKAWSQNLGHESMVTTLGSYGAVAPHRQAEIIRSLSMPNPTDAETREVEKFLEVARLAIRRIGIKAA